MKHLSNEDTPTKSAGYVLVDRDTFTNKFDHFIRDGAITAKPSQTGPHPLDVQLAARSAKAVVARLKMDIKDFDTRKLQDIDHLGTDASGAARPLVGFSKHSCGPATDLSLSSLLYPTLPPSTDSNETTKEYTK